MWGRLWPLLLSVLTAVAAPGPSPRRPCRELSTIPRTKIPYEELYGTRRFQGPAKNYATLLLEEDSARLLVGARGALFSLNAQDIGDGAHKQTECFNHVRLLQRLNATHLYVCGTHAFQPLCAAIDAEAFTLPTSFEDGREKCPYGPATGFTGLIIDGSLYTATRYEFRGFPAIRRSLHPQPLMTGDTPKLWFYDAEFVSSILVRESKASAVGDDDKVYYFFMERMAEEDPGSLDQSGSSHRVARVARVCKGDMGGKLLQQKTWTSFLKARLNCHIPKYETLRGVCSLDVDTPARTHFYAAFTLNKEWKSMEASAICRYDLTDVQDVFEGAYLEYQRSLECWTRDEGGVPEPRPGSCITDSLRSQGYNSSLNLPPLVLNFVKMHPLMAHPVAPTHGQPLLLTRTVHYTHITGTSVTTTAGPTYDLLFLSTDDGWVHKAVVLGSGMHIIEEFQVFKEPISVVNMVISPKQHSLYLGCPSGVLQIPLSTCSRYRSCYGCILARDPYCGWNPSTKACMETTTFSRTALIQDIEKGNRGCKGRRDTGQSPPPVKTRTVTPGDDVLLPCDQPSNLARTKWLLNESVGLSDGQRGYHVGVDGLLVTDTRPEHSGSYKCYSEENGLHMLLTSYSLVIRANTPARSPQLASDVRLFYVLVIAALGGLCLLLVSTLLYTACLRGRRGEHSRHSLHSLGQAGRAGGPALQLQKVSGQNPGEEDEVEHGDGAGGLENSRL